MLDSKRQAFGVKQKHERERSKKRRGGIRGRTRRE